MKGRQCCVACAAAGVRCMLWLSRLSGWDRQQFDIALPDDYPLLSGDSAQRCSVATRVARTGRDQETVHDQGFLLVIWTLQSRISKCAPGRVTITCYAVAFANERTVHIMHPSAVVDCPCSVL